MSDAPRIEELQRRVDLDPASIAFAQLAEEYRRLGQLQQAVAVSRQGLSVHPGYVSARVTLGRALLQQGDLAGAAAEFELVLQSVPSNLAALRALSDVERRRGNWDAALERSQAALALAPNDPELERSVAELIGQVEQARHEPERRRAADTVGALEQFLAAIHGARTERRA